MPTKPTLCIDIDGVIAQTEQVPYEYLDAIPEASKTIEALRAKYFIVLHTGRHYDKAQETIKWLEAKAIQYDTINFGKPPAVAYIDDKGVKFETWEKIRAEFLA